MPSTKCQNMKVACFTLDDSVNLASHVGKSLLEYMDYFLAKGIYANKSEFVRAALREKIVKLLEEDALLKDFRETKQFNESQMKEVKLEGITYKIVRRLE